MITVWADKYLHGIDSYLPDEVELHLFDPEEGLPKTKELQQAEALLIRTVIAINSDTWRQIPQKLEFLGSGSAGTDHVDTAFLDKHDISFDNAGGCNARSVAEYVTTALLMWAESQDIKLKDRSLGIVGMGHVGTQVQSILKPLDIEIIGHDPPKAEREPEFISAELSQVLSADMLSLHTPLTKEGVYPTYHWLDTDKLENHTFDLVINTARGGVVDEKALFEAFQKGRVKSFILDVWEQEPNFNDQMADTAFIKTPHIAGYSKQAKHRASRLIAESLCRHFNITPPSHSRIEDILKRIDISTSSECASSLTEILSCVHPIKDYENKLKELTGLPAKKKGYLFNKLRAEFPLRDEFKYLSIPSKIIQQYPILAKLGFSPH